MAQRIDLPVRKFIERKLKENFPELDFRRSTALNDGVANPFALLIQPFRHELDGIKIAQSLKYYNYLTDDQVDDLLFNLLVFRKNGEKAYGTIRMNFFALGDYQYDLITFVTASGLRYFNSSPISISPSSMLLDEDGTYYVDIAGESEAEGAEYSIANGQIIGIVEDLPEIARVTNPFAFTQADSKESNFDLFKRAQDSVITRTLLNEYAIKTVLFNEFPFLVDINVVGAGNSAMLRDIVNINGRSIHTYGKADIYINTNSVQEDDVDITYIPEDLTIDLVANTTTEVVFPEDTDTSSSGNNRGLYFADSLYDFGTRAYFNNILRVYQTEFNEEVFTDYVVKLNTPEGELVAVENKLEEGARLIAYGPGYVSVDGMTHDLEGDCSFIGLPGQGDNYALVNVNGPNFMYNRSVPTATLTLTGCEGSADSRVVYLNGISISALTSTLTLKFVVTKGDAVGVYDFLKGDSVSFSAFGQEKYTETKSLSGTLDSYTFVGNAERCISENDHLIILSAGVTYATTITAVDLNFKYINFVTVGIGTGIASISIRDGLHGTLESTDRCYIFQDDFYTSRSSAYPLGSTVTSTSYGTGDSLIKYVKSRVLTTTHLNLAVGDYVREGASLGLYEVIAVPSVCEFIVRGDMQIGSTVSIWSYKNKDIPSFSPVLAGAPFTLYASGIYDSTVNQCVLTSPGGYISSFVHPNLAVNAITLTSSTNQLHLINYSQVKSFASIPNPLSTFGIDGLKFTHAMGSSLGLVDGDFWAIVKSNSSTPCGGSTWNDVFSWYSTPTLDNVTTYTYPNTNPQMQLVIAGGPNTGIYNVTELTDSKSIRIDTELSEVSSTTVSNTVFSTTHNLGDITLSSEVISTAIVLPGDTLKITSGLAEGFYRVIARTPTSLTLNTGLTGTVFANVDTYEIVRDYYQPFFLIGNEERFPNSTILNNFEVWTPMEPIRRMAEGSNANFGVANKVTDNSTNYKLQFANIPVNGTTVTILDGPSIGEERAMVGWEDASVRTATYSGAAVSGSSKKYEMNRIVQNLYQQKYQIIDNHDYYKDKLFVLPTLFIRSVNEIDPITSSVIGDPLIPNYDYFLYCRDENASTLRYSAHEKNILKFKESWMYKAMRITYLGDPNITLVDQFVSTDVMRTTNNDMLVKRMESTVVDVYCQVEGLDQATAVDIIEKYITNQSSTDPVQASDIIALLYNEGATYINTESFLFKSYYLPPVTSGDMWIFNPGSRNEIQTPAHSTYIPGTINVEVING